MRCYFLKKDGKAKGKTFIPFLIFPMFELI